jgi:drug/metabolite transporter (DMT)-like permease
VTVEERRGLALVAIAVLFFSASPVLVRWAARSLSSFEIAAGRLLVAGILVLGVALLRSRVKLRATVGRDLLAVRAEWRRFALIGLVTALHFFFYAYSLEFTTIAHSLAIMYTAPIFVALLSRLMFAEPLSIRKWLGVVVAVLGVAVLSGFEPNFTRRMLIGDLLALGSAITFAIYSIAGRGQRERYPLLVYAGSVYILAALWLLPVAAVAHTPGSFNWLAVASIVGLGVFPLACGHTLYNAALRRLNATYVNLIATQEVLGGVLLGALLLREIPSFNSIIGGLITIGGILLVLL